MQGPGFPYVYFPPHGYPVPIAHPPGAPVYYVPGAPPPPEAAAFPGYPPMYPLQYLPAAQAPKLDVEAKTAEGQPPRTESGALPLPMHPYAYHPYAVPHPSQALLAATEGLSAGLVTTAAVASASHTLAKPREASATAPPVPMSSVAASGPTVTATKPPTVHMTSMAGPPPGYPYHHQYFPHVQHPYYMSARPPPTSKPAVPAAPTATVKATADRASTSFDPTRSAAYALSMPWLNPSSAEALKLFPPAGATHHSQVSQQQQQRHAVPVPVPSAPQDNPGDVDVGRSKWSSDAVLALERLVNSYEGTQIKRDDFYANVHDELAVLGYTHSKRAIQTKIGMLGLLNKVKIQFTWTDEEDKAALSRLARSSDFGAILQQLKSRGLCVGRTLQDFEKRCREHYMPIVKERSEMQDQDAETESAADGSDGRGNQTSVRQMREWTAEEEHAVAEAVKPYLTSGEQINWHAVREELNKQELCLDRTENAIACHYRKTPRKRKRNPMRMPVQFHTDEELQKKQKQIRKQLFSNPTQTQNDEGSDGSQRSTESASDDQETAVFQGEFIEPWTAQEDDLLLELILASHPPYDWRDILAKMQARGLAENRSTRQVLARYCHHYQREMPGVAVDEALGRDAILIARGATPEPSRRAELAKVDITETLSVMSSTKLQRPRPAPAPEQQHQHHSTPSVDSGLLAAQTVANALANDQSLPPPKEIVGMALVLGWTYHVPTASTSLPINKNRKGGVWVRSDVACESISAASARKGVDFFETNAEFTAFLKQRYPIAGASPSSAKAT